MFEVTVHLEWVLEWKFVGVFWCVCLYIYIVELLYWMVLIEIKHKKRYIWSLLSVIVGMPGKVNWTFSDLHNWVSCHSVDVHNFWSECNKESFFLFKSKEILKRERYKC